MDKIIRPKVLKTITVDNGIVKNSQNEKSHSIFDDDEVIISESIVSKKKSLLDDDNVPADNSFDLSESIVEFFINKSDIYDIEDLIKEYKELNEDLITAMETLDNVFLIEYVYANDYKNLNGLNLNYRKRYIRKKSKDNLKVNDDIFSNIVHATLSETYNNSIVFFGSEHINKWESKLNEYRNNLISFGGKHALETIAIVNTLYKSLSELHKDYNGIDNSFHEYFNFPFLVDFAEKNFDLSERKGFFNMMILNCNKMCLTGQIKNVDTDEQAQFIRKCEKAIEIIEFEKNNFGSENNVDNDLKHDEELLQKIKDLKQESDSLPESDITLNRQFLAIYYMLNAIDNKTFTRNKSEIARFIQMLTGKNYDNIYKKVKNPLKDPSEKTGKKYQDDIHFLIETFRNLGLNKVAQTIENDNLFG